MCECLEKCCTCKHGCKPLWKFIKDFDIFGHPVKLNFNKNGTTHKTMIGGVASVGFYVASIVVALAILIPGSDETNVSNTPVVPRVNLGDDTAEI